MRQQTETALGTAAICVLVVLVTATLVLLGLAIGVEQTKDDSPSYQPPIMRAVGTVHATLVVNVNAKPRITLTVRRLECNKFRLVAQTNRANRAVRFRWTPVVGGFAEVRVRTTNSNGTARVKSAVPIWTEPGGVTLFRARLYGPNGRQVARSAVRLRKNTCQDEYME